MFADGGLHLEDPAEDFLGGEAVEGSGQAEEAGRVGEEGVGEGGADEVGGVGGDVAAFVVAVEGEVEAEEVLEAGVGGTAFVEEGGEVVAPVLVLVDRGFGGGVVEDGGGDAGEFGEEGDAVVEGGFPVLAFVEAVGVCFGEGGFGVEGCDGTG